jgi:arginine exporter protein ArgO
MRINYKNIINGLEIHINLVVVMGLINIFMLRRKIKRKITIQL